MKLGGIIATVAVLAFVAGAAVDPAWAQGTGGDPETDPEAAMDEALPNGDGVPPPLMPLTIGADGAITAPSGQVVTFVDTVRDEAGPDGQTVRFRFLAPAIARKGGTVSAEQAQSDMQALCDGYALPRLADAGPAQIVISLADRPVVFGEANPDATQFFESFRPENGRCIWEAF